MYSFDCGNPVEGLFGMTGSRVC